MAITREKKEELVALYQQQITNSSAMVFTNYKGVNVARLRSLRGRLKENGTTYMVVKNKLMAIALENVGRNQPGDLLTGTNGVAFLGEDIGRSVTALKDWIKEAKVLEITGAMLETSVLNAQQAESLSDLPPKEQTLSMLLGTSNAPASSLVRIINAPGASLARVINAYVEKRQEAEAEAA